MRPNYNFYFQLGLIQFQLLKVNLIKKQCFMDYLQFILLITKKFLLFYNNNILDYLNKLLLQLAKFCNQEKKRDMKAIMNLKKIYNEILQALMHIQVSMVMMMMKMMWIFNLQSQMLAYMLHILMKMMKFYILNLFFKVYLPNSHNFILNQFKVQNKWNYKFYNKILLQHALNMKKKSNKSKQKNLKNNNNNQIRYCLLYTSPSPRDRQKSRMPSSA
eukprot:TRINITY_DN10148_c0_g1_i1.p1 TRINITY_DN10148_c0_g1~~TRINITY_DN10148_c0_g1_i1.p1  ORF type:complete len:217 (-),score=20.74 TRINITY_DN10148_c0_g1_i1:21-671(-)